MDRQRQAKRYEGIKRIIQISESILTLLLLIAFVYSGYSVHLRNWVRGYLDHPYLQLLLFTVVVGAAFTIISFPINVFSTFWLEHRFKLSNQTFAAWLWERVKGWLVGIVVFIPILLIFYYFLRNFPDMWWLLTAIVLFFVSVIIGRLAPQIIFPLFYKFEPLQVDDIKQRMQKLAETGNFNLNGVYRFNMSKTTKKANAAFTGIGKSKRIILGDTLLDQFSADEIEAVFAHEVGHFVHRHIWLGMAVSTISSFLSLYVAHRLYMLFIANDAFTGVDDLAALPFLSIILTLIAFVTTPLTNALSRRHEWQADRYALQHASQPAAFVTAIKKLSEINLTDTDPHPLLETLFHSHPSVRRRVEAANAQLGL